MIRHGGGDLCGGALALAVCGGSMKGNLRGNSSKGWLDEIEISEIDDAGDDGEEKLFSGGTDDGTMVSALERGTKRP